MKFTYKMSSNINIIMILMRFINTKSSNINKLSKFNTYSHLKKSHFI